MSSGLFHLLRFAAKRIWARYVFGAWFLLGAWSTAAPQLLPTQWLEESPNFLAVLVSMNEYVPLWVWPMIGLVLLLAITVEYGLLEHRKAEQGIRDPEIIQLRSDVKRLVRTLTGYGSPKHQRDDILAAIQRVEDSNHAVWLGSEMLYQARVDFLHWCSVTASVREQHGVGFRDKMERDETLACLKDAAGRLEAGLTGRNIPDEKFPPPLEP